MQISAANIIPYGMQTGATAMPANAAARTIPVTPIAPVTRQDQRANAWIDASWTEAPARPAQIDPYDTGDISSELAFAAQRYAQTDGSATAPMSLHQLGAEAYRAAQGDNGQYQRGDLGIDLVV